MLSENLHPATKQQITQLLKHFGELSWYGLKEICLVQNPAAQADKLKFGALSVPGKILLYEQPKSPWICSGKVANFTVLKNAGAIISESTGGGRCKIEWSPEALRDFMLFDVLMK